MAEPASAPWSRRALLSALACTPLLGCNPELARVSAAQVLALYDAGDLAAIESLMPGGSRVLLTDVVFDDWAYPDPARVAATQDPTIWREALSRDAEGGPVNHGIKLRIGGVDPGKLHRSGPKVIAFLPYSSSSEVGLLKQAYLERCTLACTVSYIGVLRSAVWDEAQVAEDDMVGLWLHAVRRA